MTGLDQAARQMGAALYRANRTDTYRDAIEAAAAGDDYAARVLDGWNTAADAARRILNPNR